MYAEVFLVGLLAAISPGPDFVVVTRNSLAFGRRAGMATALGIGTALVAHVSYTILGFALVIQQSPQLFRLIQVMGAAYLAWLGWGAIRSAPSLEPVHEDAAAKAAGGLAGAAPGGLGGFRDGLLTNLLNPKAALFFLSIFSQFLTPGTPGWVRWVYGGEIIVAVTLWFLLLSALIASKRFRTVYGRYRHWGDRLLGAALLYVAVRILVA